MDNLITFLVDGRTYVLLRDTFSKHPDSLLTKIINFEVTDKSVIYSGNHSLTTFYVNKDPKSFKYVVDYLRGYPVIINKIKNENLRNKVLMDFNYFGLKEEITLGVEVVEDKELYGKEALENILKTDTDSYEDKDTPLLTQFSHLLFPKGLGSEQSVNNSSNTTNIVDLVTNLNKSLEDGSLPDHNLINELSYNKDLIDFIRSSQKQQQDDINAYSSDTDSEKLNSDES
ncbi:MAG: BTB/POZ domain protein [Barrevirus sp.]|uniref:BTB/POZ domain protein n=1 Tax=Barrevirus sp. TaxID=2487763 RepID=A0A3G4ZPV9_9VIRU|nr:MAG: BTB/POZ domain protein [Barrevirus sp.]